MTRTRILKIGQLSLISLAALALALPRPAAAASCIWTPKVVSVWSQGWLVLRVANDQGTEKIVRLCTMKTVSSGTVEPEACSAYYGASLAALATGSKIQVTLTDSVLDSMGAWGGTCDSITGQTNLDPALFAVGIIAPSQ